MNPFKLGDRVRRKSNPSEQGEVIQLTERCCRIIMQSPLGKLWWYDYDELELM